MLLEGGRIIQIICTRGNMESMMTMRHNRRCPTCLRRGNGTNCPFQLGAKIVNNATVLFQHKGFPSTW